MLRGLYTAASGMISQQRRHDVITNNIANVNTPGFKQDQAMQRSFPEMLIHIMRDGAVPRKIGSMHSGVITEEKVPIFLQGDLQETENTYDLALVSNIQVPGVVFDPSGKGTTPEGETVYQPQAFFTVLNENGDVRYTRNGKFTVDVSGQLVTPEGYRVLGQDSQPIIIGNYNEVNITKNGEILDPANNLPIAGAPRIQLSRVDNPNLLLRDGNGVYRLDESAPPAQVIDGNDQVEIHQGFIERSNVDPTQSMVDMMTVLRAYEANQKVIQFYDRSMEKAVNEVGKI